MYPLEEARNKIISKIKEALSQLKYKCDIKLETPPENMGDFAFPCFVLAPVANKKPTDIAKEIAGKIKKDKWIEKIEIKGAYVNFYLNIDHLKETTFNIISKKQEQYGYLDKKNKKVIIEHTSANPNGPLHVGRARNPIIGDTLVRIFKAAGYDVQSQFYLDDMGKQVAILTWGVNHLKPSDIPKSSYNKPDHQTVGQVQVPESEQDLSGHPSGWRKPG